MAPNHSKPVRREILEIENVVAQQKGLEGPDWEEVRRFQEEHPHIHLDLFHLVDLDMCISDAGNPWANLPSREEMCTTFDVAGLPRSREEHLPWLEKLPGPEDELRKLEDQHMHKYLRLDPTNLRRYGVDDGVRYNMLAGTSLQHESVFQPVQIGDYEKTLQHLEVRNDRIAELLEIGVVMNIPPGCQFTGTLNVSPALVIVKESKIRYVTDFSKTHLNRSIHVSPVDYKGLSDLIRHMRPNAWIFGLDVKDCFHLWPLAAEDRRNCAINSTNGYATYGFLPQGLNTDLEFFSLSKFRCSRDFWSSFATTHARWEPHRDKHHRYEPRSK